MLTIKPYINESYDKFFKRINEQIIKYNSYLVSIEEILKTTDDFEKISEVMQIAYRKKFILNNDILNEMVKLHFDTIFNRMKEDKKLRGQFNVSNDISFETFQELTDEFIQEKENLMKAYEKNEFEPISSIDDSYVSKFKELLINSFFDKRFKNSIKDENSINQYVERAISLYNLANDLENQIFEKVMYDASHSPELKRNNDVRSALIRKIYELYNPFYLLSYYEKAKNEFLNLLEKKD